MNHLVAEFAKETGVSTADVKKVLDKLGLDAVTKESAAIVGHDKVANINLGQLKLAVRLGRSSLAV